jgi:hypothetical protein
MAASGGVSRRRVMIGGSATVAATAAAWTAPSLMASAAAAVGLSACPPDQIKVCTDGSQTCCPGVLDTCNIVNNEQVCSPPTEPGGFCGNCGNGSCKEGYKCNGNDTQSNNAEATNLCGGEGAQCCPGNEDVAGCFADNLTCVSTTEAGTGFCRKECSTAADCRTDGVTAGNENCPQIPGAQTCADYGSANYCAKTCSKDSDCNAGTGCATPPGGGPKVCLYKVDGNLSAICAAA